MQIARLLFASKTSPAETSSNNSVSRIYLGCDIPSRYRVTVADSCSVTLAGLAVSGVTFVE